MTLVDNDWKSKLTPEQYRVLREKGTEPPFSGKYNNHHERGIYLCAACGEPIFSSESTRARWISKKAPLDGGEAVA